MPKHAGRPSPNSKLNIAGIGVGGRGSAHVEAFLNENLVAICDVVESAANGCLGQIERFNTDHGLNRPMPKTFSDYREMFDKMHGQIDAVFVAAPDHHHAPASMTAIKLGKHVYCEKPLTHNIDEARQLTLAARQYKVATQLGNKAARAKAGGGCASGSGPAPSATSKRCTSGPIGRAFPSNSGGRKADAGRPAPIRCPPA